MVHNVLSSLFLCVRLVITTFITPVFVYTLNIFDWWNRHNHRTSRFSWNLEKNDTDLTKYCLVTRTVNYSVRQRLLIIYFRKNLKLEYHVSKIKSKTTVYFFKFSRNHDAAALEFQEMIFLYYMQSDVCSILKSSTKVYCIIDCLMEWKWKLIYGTHCDRHHYACSTEAMLY